MEEHILAEFRLIGVARSPVLPVVSKIVIGEPLYLVVIVELAAEPVDVLCSAAEELLYILLVELVVDGREVTAEVLAVFLGELP